MRKIIFAITLAVICATTALAQKARSTGSAGAAGDTSVSKRGQQVSIQSDTQVAAQLENTLDVRHAKPGDRVVMKTLQPIRQNGQTIVPKGSRLVGHVTDVAQRTKSSGESRLGIALDQLQKGSTNIPITGSIMSVVQASNRTSAFDNDLFANDTMTSSSSSTRTTTTSRSGGGGGGLLGGVGNTVGGATNTTTSTVGSVAGNTTNAVGNTVGNTTGTVRNTTGQTTGSLRGLQVSSSASASADGSSTLTLGNGNLRLDSGTTFNLLISGSASRNNNQ